MSSFRCDFLVSCVYAFQDASHLYVVMPLMLGGDLRYYLKQNGPCRESEARFYMAELLLALEHMHSLRIVYRDLKPDNVLLDEAGHIRLSDFGLSARIRSADGKTSGFCGTLGYVAPEVRLTALPSSHCPPSSAHIALPLTMWPGGGCMWNCACGTVQVKEGRRYDTSLRHLRLRGGAVRAAVQVRAEQSEGGARAAQPRGGHDGRRRPRPLSRTAALPAMAGAWRLAKLATTANSATTPSTSPTPLPLFPPPPFPRLPSSLDLR